MDPVKNPYAPGAGSEPPELTGRDAILADTGVALARVKSGKPERGLFLTGLRGVGKTVLLERIRKTADAEGYIADLLEAPEDGTLAALLIPSLRAALLKVSVRAKAKQLAEKAMRVLAGFTVSAKVEGVEWAVKYEAELGTADSGILQRDLPELMAAVGEAAAANGKAIAILIDEIQYLSKGDLSALIVSAHRIAQRRLPIAIMGAGLPLLPALSGDAKTYAERLFRYPKIGPLAERDARRALEEPANDLGVKFDSDALDAIVETTAGYPYFIQEWGSATWNVAARSPITRQDVEAARAAAIGSLDESFFRVRLERVTEGEQRYLRGMAQLGPGPHKSNAIAKILGRTKTADFGPVRDSLIKKGMIYSPKFGMQDFTVPLFDEFMRRAVPTFRASRPAKRPSE